MKIDVEKIKTAYEAASAEQKEQIEKMFPGAFECAKSEAEETIETLIGKIKAWQNQNKDKRAVALFATDKDRTEEKGNSAIYIGGYTAMLLNLAIHVGTQSDIKKPLAKLFALAITNNIKANKEDSKHGTDN